MEKFIDTVASDASNPGEWDPKAVYDKLPAIQHVDTTEYHEESAKRSRDEYQAKNNQDAWQKIRDAGGVPRKRSQCGFTNYKLLTK